MMFDFSERTALLLGERNVDILASSNVLVFGLGGVGGYCAETLIRSGIGSITAVDGDRISLSNINRQLLTLHSNVGRFKTEVFKERALDINPALNITIYSDFYGREPFSPSSDIDFSAYDFIADCTDDVRAKTAIITRAIDCGVPVITALGAGNRAFSTGFYVCDLFETKGDPLARSLRRNLKKAGIAGGVLSCVCSDGPDRDTFTDAGSGEKIITSAAFSPAASGITMGAEIVKRLLDK